MPASGQAYINMHLDYGVKGGGTDFNPKETFADRYDKGEIGCGGSGEEPFEPTRLMDANVGNSIVDSPEVHRWTLAHCHALQLH